MTAKPLGEMLDTPEPARRFYFETLASLTPGERLRMANAASRMIRTVAEAAVRANDPDAHPSEVAYRVAVRVYGRETVERILGPAPLEEGDTR